MAKCEVCGKEMSEEDGCGTSKIHIGGKVFDRIKCGSEEDFDSDMAEKERCHDCGAKKDFIIIGDVTQNVARLVAVS